MHADTTCGLVLDACDLVERHATTAHRDDALLHEVALLRAALCDAGTCEDDMVAGDVSDAICALDALAARLEALPDRGPQHLAA